jgi:hypothetical protein
MAYELPVYRTEELLFPGMELPGYAVPGNMRQMDKHRSDVWGSSDWFPTLSLSVFRRHPDDSERIQALTGIRSNSSTHEGVVSTLTSALPPPIAPLLIAEKKPYLTEDYPDVVIGKNGPDSRERGVVASYRPNIQFVPDNVELLPFLCHDIFARKLGAGELLGARFGEEHLGRVSLSRITIGLSYVDDDPDGTPLWEPLMMFGAAFMLNDAYRDALPERTSRYSQLGWTDDVSTFAQDVDDKNVMKLAPYVDEGEAVNFCARGLCLGTTATLAISDDLRAHLGLAA